MKKLSMLLIWAVMTSCNVSKQSSKSSQESSQNKLDAQSGSIRKEINEDWSQIYSSLFHKNGEVWIEFDSITRVNLTPQGIQAIGYNPVIHGQVMSIQQDSSQNTGKKAIIITQDSTMLSSEIQQEKKTEEHKEKEQTSQKIAPILVLVVVILIVLIYIAKQVKLF